MHSPRAGGLVSAITEQEAAILSATGNAECWHLDVRFPTAGAASAFHQTCHEAGFPIDITSVHDTAEDGPDRPAGLTRPQREILELALEEGYFAIPRNTTLVDLATELGVSDQAAGERLRRAYHNLATAYLRE